MEEHPRRAARHRRRPSVPAARAAGRPRLRDRDLQQPEAGVADVLARLARHGVEAEPTVRRAEPAGAGETLIALGRELGSDLICVGAYGHDRAREWIFGGVTQHLLTQAGHCVLFSR
jgi:nucleotide-binding universal stress UspA family protein